MRTVAAVFPSEAEAEKTAKDLESLGIAGEEILVAGGTEHSLNKIVSARRNMSAAAASGAGWLFAGIIPEIVTRSSPAGGAGIGALVGVVLGAIGGLIVHVPANSPFHAFSVFAVILGGMALGAAAGGFVAWMYSLGVSHEAVAFCAEADREHGVVVSAHVSEASEPEAIRVMQEHGAAKVAADIDPWVASGWTGPHPFEQEYPSDSTIRTTEIPALRE